MLYEEMPEERLLRCQLRNTCSQDTTLQNVILSFNWLKSHRSHVTKLARNTVNHLYSDALILGKRN
jgi:hypothetical protein